MFIGAVYLFQSNCGNCLKQVLFIIYATILFSGCGSYLNSEKPSPEKIINIQNIKNQIIKKLSFLPYINYVPSIKPTVYGTILLKELLQTLQQTMALFGILMENIFHIHLIQVIHQIYTL